MRKTLAVCLLLAAANFASAATWYVRPDDGRTTKTGATVAFAFDKISSATAVAVTNDTILVAGGTYLERGKINVQNTKDNLTIRGSYVYTTASLMVTTSTLTPTIVDGQGIRAGIKFDRVNFSISDFKFVNCRANGQTVNGVLNETIGGGLHAAFGIATVKTGTIRRCVFENCFASGTGSTSGAAIEVGFTTAATAPNNHRINLINVQVTSCTASASANASGTGYTAVDFNRTNGTPIVFVNGLVIRDCIAANNSLAFRCANSSMITSMTNVLLFNIRNMRTGSGDGGIAHIRGRLGSYINNMTVDSCSAPNFFFDIDTGGNTAGTNYMAVANNIFSNNTATTDSAINTVPTLFWTGANVTNYYERFGHFKNNLFYNNSGTTQTLKIMANNAGTPTEYDSQILADTSNRQGGTTATALNPRYVAPYPVGSNYHLSVSGSNISSARDAGIASYAVLNSRASGPLEVISFPTNDLDGRARPHGAGWDQGVYEFDFSVPVELSHFGIE